MSETPLPEVPYFPQEDLDTDGTTLLGAITGGKVGGGIAESSGGAGVDDRERHVGLALLDRDATGDRAEAAHEQRISESRGVAKAPSALPPRR